MPDGSGDKHNFDHTSSSDLNFLPTNIMGFSENNVNELSSNTMNQLFNDGNNNNTMTIGQQHPSIFNNTQHHRSKDSNSTKNNNNNNNNNNNTPSMNHSHQHNRESSSTRSKRKRVQPEALKLLKNVYRTTSHPSIKQRKELSRKVNMSERSVTVWFQNRRANTKKKQRLAQEKRQRRKGDSKRFASDSDDSSNDDSDSLSDISDEADKLDSFDQAPLDINMNYNLIDINIISVGSWNRRKTGIISNNGLERIKEMRNLSPDSIYRILDNETDMVVLISKKNQEINYFFCAPSENGKVLFRMFYPIRIVSNCTLTLESDSDLTSNKETVNIGELKLDLDKPPTFAVHYSNSNNPDIQNLPNQNQWSLCGDFSDGRQVNDAYVGGSNMPHCLKGLQSSLIYMNSLILDQKASRSSLSMDISPNDNLPMSGSSMSPATDLSNIPPAVIAAVHASIAANASPNSMNQQTPINFDPNMLLGLNSSDMSYSNNNIGTPNDSNFSQQQRNLLENTHTLLTPFTQPHNQSDNPLIPHNENYSEMGLNSIQLEDYFLGNSYLADVNDTLLSSFPPHDNHDTNNTSNNNTNTNHNKNNHPF
ncbi:similar to Saccharomyces cerevisiae YDL106C PHO2 Homeobox transcription factor [Maudiozyma barnettii]|uniref:Similar to Saccharomyces cerevisiae YDL106C PHO2 Homeobox transcription factor n=1 Tax=Maudiozyma barnettii TaxID=61262 RepID=A0A8H2VKJ5_9SACH|nr:Pho2p [Kazachstania barnettii]CAB4257071.1 similar to Saccharomyces cerevisiae YDL106C PHO2 Homeobox transcription factor [Kazachstania barnettii]CAD1779442.1 similar to Saccharomyces cerevisiae YDL106C PHO2 Homeobox transcription factor [Kazachstania barnettii]